MRIATFNANSVRARLDLIVEWLARNSPDLLCLQETKVQDQDFPADAFEAAGYQVVFRGEKSYNGVAVASRLPLAEVSFGFDDEPRDETRLARARISELHLVNAYVPQGRALDSPHFRYKLEWFDRLRSLFEAHYKPEELVLWVGDMNVAPEPKDVYDPAAKLNHVCFHESVRAALRRVLEWGFVDLFRLHCQEPEQYTFWDYRVPAALESNRGWRLDHFFGTQPLARLCTKVHIDRSARAAPRPSDHTFVVGDFDL